MTKQFIFIILIAISFKFIGQPPAKFYCTYGGNGYDVGYDVKQTLDGGYVIVGSTSSWGQGQTDVYLLKIDSLGQKQFETTFGGVANEIGKSIVQLIDSSYVLTGYTSSSGIGGYDVILIKADKTGALIWQKTMGGIDWDFAHSIQSTTDGGFIIAGSTYSFGNGNEDGYVIKTNSNGDTTWTKTFGGLKDDAFKSVIQTNDGNYALTGYTKSFNDSLSDGLVYRLDANGLMTYSTSVGGTYPDEFNNVIQLPNNNLYFVGSNKSFKNGINSVNWRFLIDNTNTVIVNDFIGSTNTERYNSSAVGINGKIICVGYNNYLGNSSDANIHIFNSGLGFVAYNPFGVQNSDELLSVNRTKDKGFVSVGTCFGNTSLLSDILFVKTDSVGSFGTSIVGLKENKVKDFSVKVYPNPTTNYLIIDMFNNKNLNETNYQINDLNGRTLISGKLIQEQQKVYLENLASGLYFLNIYDSNNHIITYKISVLK